MRILPSILILSSSLLAVACGGGHTAPGEPTAPSESKANALRRVQLDAAQQKQLNVQSAVSGPARVDRRISLPASIEASPHMTVHMTSRVPGVIKQLHVRLGVAVEKGTPLLRIDSVEIGEAARDYLRALEPAGGSEADPRRGAQAARRAARAREQGPGPRRRSRTGDLLA